MRHTIAKANRILLILYFLVATLCLLPALNVAFNSSELVFGIPVSVVWLTCCFAAFVGLSIWGYIAVFSPWASDRMSSQGENS